MCSSPLSNDKIVPVNITIHSTVIPCILILLPTMCLFGTLGFILFIYNVNVAYSNIVVSTHLQGLFQHTCKACIEDKQTPFQHQTNSNYTDDFPIHEDEWQKDQYTPTTPTKERKALQTTSSVPCKVAKV